MSLKWRNIEIKMTYRMYFTIEFKKDQKMKIPTPYHGLESIPMKHKNTIMNTISSQSKKIFLILMSKVEIHIFKEYIKPQTPY